MYLIKLFVTMVLCFTFSLPALAKGEPNILNLMDTLWDEAKAGTEDKIIEDSSKRGKIVHQFVKKLEKFDDKGLGNVKLIKAEHQQDLAVLQQSLEQLLYEYHKHVRPVLLNNLRLKRNDSGVKVNKVDLSRLMFPTKYNHKTRRPIAGIFNYKQNISNSMFSSEIVDAGLLINFPELEKALWVKNTIKMDDELSAIWRMHRSYTEGVKFGRTYSKKSDEQVDTKVAKSNLSDMPAYKREKVVRKFVRGLEKLDGKQSFTNFRQELVQFLQIFETLVKPILVDNVNLKRFDIGARANRGDLFSLFYKHQRNYYTGKPITSKLKHTGSSKQELGYLLLQPELAQDDVVKAALTMEKSLAQLLKEHDSYLKEDNSVMW